jgi:hypothetical protein
VEPLEVVEQIGSCLVASPILTTVHAFPLEDSEEALAGSVVGAVTDRAHAADERVATEELLVGTALVKVSAESGAKL